VEQSAAKPGQAGQAKDRRQISAFVNEASQS
jgi:hypothetical protein